MKNFADYTLADWLSYLEHQHSKEIHLGLERVRVVALKMELLKPPAKVITIAGTNGKGSTVATLESIYTEAGYQVGSYTSPHLFTFNERIRLNQQPIGDNSLCQAFSEVEKARGEVFLSYFEATTLAALWYFNQNELDVIILEVGMGGRLDATNIIDTDLAIITTIDYDHQQFLGHTREEIGFEKAGIIRKNQPVIYADSHPPQAIFDQVEKKRAHLFCLNRDYQYQILSNEIQLKLPSSETISLPKSNIHPNSLCAGVVASQCLNDVLPVSSLQWVNALKKVFIPGRLQFFQEPVLTLLDVAHNNQSAKRLADYLHNIPCQGRIHVVFSAFKDKDIYGLLKPLEEVVDFWHTVPLESKRAASKEELFSAFENALGLKPTWSNNPLVAYETATKKMEDGDILVVYGSFLLVGMIMQERYNQGSGRIK